MICAGAIKLNKNIMKSFEEIQERAITLKGSIEAVEKRMPACKTVRALKKMNDSTYLSFMSRRIFRAGLRHSMVDAKWPDFERVFFDFDIDQVRMMSDDALENLLNDKSIIRHWGKIKSVRANAQTISDILGDHNSFADYLNSWPENRIVELWGDLSSRFTHLGGNSGPYFLRMVGKDTFLLTHHVATALNQWGAYQGEPKSKKARAKVQEVFNQWAEESGKPLSHISMTLAMSID
jgi:3-methyladenine DNA glycosylase Tag